MGDNSKTNSLKIAMKNHAHPALTKRLAVATAVLALLLTNAAAWACASDADCGTGGSCIKREKRASGVCYGGTRAAPAAETQVDEATTEDIVDVPIKPVSGERREDDS